MAIAFAGCKPSLEKQILGSWKGDPAKSEIPETKPGDVAATKAMLGSTTLELKEDKTFKFNLIFSMEGTWTLAADKLSLKGKDGAKLANSDTMDFVVAGDGKTMTFTSTDPKSPGKLVMVKSS